MSNALQSSMTAEEYLAWEERQELRYEFDGFKPRAMTGGTRRHALIQSRLITTVAGRLRGSKCDVVGSELKVSVDRSFRYPDAMIFCTPGDAKATVLDDPVVVFEIVSPSTERVDRIVKSEEYRNTPSVQAYVMLQQDFVGATVFRRVGDVWSADTYGPGSTIMLPGAGIDLPIDDVYEGLDLPA